MLANLISPTLGPLPIPLSWKHLGRFSKVWPSPAEARLHSRYREGGAARDRADRTHPSLVKDQKVRFWFLMHLAMRGPSGVFKHRVSPSWTRRSLARQVQTSKLCRSISATAGMGSVKTAETMTR